MTKFAEARQTTLANNIELTGTGVHTGAPVSVTLYPSDSDSGIRFLVPGGDNGGVILPADFRAVTSNMLCTVLSDGNGTTVSTVEHLLAALRGLGVDNVLIEIDSGEVPILDGSSKPFVDAIDEAGIHELNRRRQFIKVLKPVRVSDGLSWAEFHPHNGFHLDIEIEYDTPVIGVQRLQLEVTPGSFRRELARARTFGFMHEVEKLWAAGLALGASLENTVAIGDDRVVNQEGTRYPDEFVRHKALDAVGDLALAGAPMLCAYRSSRGGHKLNHQALEMLLQDLEAWEFVETERLIEVSHGELHVGLAAASYTADLS